MKKIVFILGIVLVVVAYKYKNKTDKIKFAEVEQKIVVTILNASITSINVLCNGGSTGSAFVNASGGTPAYTYSWSTSQNINALTAGSYTCTIKDANLCAVVKTVTITQPTALLATTSSTNESASGMNDGFASVNASGGTPAYTYMWNTSQTTPTVNGLTGGTYTCVITDSKSCSITKTISVATSIPTGINELNKTNSTLVYPNPSNGNVNVITEENSIVTVSNNLGQIVLQFTADSKVSNINIENAGIYTVQISKNNQVSNSRLIIQ